MIHYEYYQQKNGFEGENSNKFSELTVNKRKESKHGPFKIYDPPNLDQPASKEEIKLAEIEKTTVLLMLQKSCFLYLF